MASRFNGHGSPTTTTSRHGNVHNVLTFPISGKQKEPLDQESCPVPTSSMEATVQRRNLFESHCESLCMTYAPMPCIDTCPHYKYLCLALLVLKIHTSQDSEVLANVALRRLHTAKKGSVDAQMCDANGC